MRITTYQYVQGSRYITEAWASVEDIPNSVIASDIILYRHRSKKLHSRAVVLATAIVRRELDRLTAIVKASEE